MANWWDTDAADAPAQQPEQPQWWSADAADAPAPAASGPLPVAQQNEPGWRGQSPNPVIRPDGPQPLPLTPPPNGGTYQGGVAVRPILGHDEQYAPTGQTHIPTQGMFGAAANSLMQGAIAGTADIGAGGIRLAGQVIDPEEAAGRALSGQKPLPDWAATDKLADTVSGAGQSLAGNFPVDSDLAKKSWVKGASMIGGGLPYLAAAAVSGPAGWFSAGAAGAAQTYESIYKEAVAHGASPDQAHADALIPALLSAPLMSVQAGVLLKGLPFGMQQALLRPIVDTAASSGTMVGVSELQKLIANANAQNTYDPSRPTLEGVGEDIVPEAMAGAALHGAAMAGHGVRAGVEALRQPDAAPELRVGAEGIREAGEWYQQDRPAGEAQASPQAAPEQPPAPEPAPATEQATAPAREAAAPIPQGGFERRAGSVMSRLQADLGLTPEQAAGVVGNLGHESGLQEINERHPIVPGSRGGFGWAQWTGPRRDAFEQFAKENGMSVTDPEANYQFLVHELTGPESGALDALRKTGTVEDATRAFVEAYERPKVVAMGSRLDFARKALGAEAPEGGQSGHAAQGEAVAQRVYAGDIGVDVRPEVVELSDLVASHDADGRVNPEYPHEDGLQPRDRTTVGSQTQVREIASKLNPELLKPQPDASGGAPIVSPKNVVENGNGRIAALSLAYSDPSLADRAADYRNMLSTMGFDIEGMKQPVLVSRRLTPLAEPDLQQFVKNTADRTTLAMNPAERARADATLAGRAIDLWQGREAGAAANAPFVRAFMQGIPASERGNMIGSDGRLSAAGEKRVQGAVVAHAYGDQLGPTLDRFVTGDAEGLKAIAGGLNDAAGAWAQMRSEASKGHVPAALDITGDLAHAVQIVDQARQTGRPVPELLAQHDLDRPVSPMTAELVRGFYRDDGMTKPAGREAVADRLRAYAEEAAKTPDGNDMFGAPPPPAPEVLKAASLRLAQRKLSGRDGAAARAAGARDEKGLPEDAATARERLRVGAQAMMRFLGLPPEVGLRLVDKIVAGAHGADGAYTHGLIELALDTKPADLPAKLFHESVHALLDPKLELLTKGQREALMAGADGWLRRGDNRARVEALYGKDRALVREEAVARMGEEAFKAGLLARSAAGRVYSRLVNAVRGLGQVLRGQGYATADDVFRGVLRGDRALPGSREALLAAGPRDPMRGMLAAAGVPNGAAAADDRQMAQPERQQTPTAAPQDAADSGFTDPTARAIAETGAAPERYLAKRDRDEAPLLSDRAGLERAGQLAIPGAERDERGALQRRADAPLAKGGQKAADDLPLFDHMKRDQPSLFALRAYHGSPWDFDRFDIGKIGTGEGAQAYGHGLYYAESEKVAKSYRDALSKGRMPPDDVMRRYFKPGEIVPSYGGRDRVIAYKNDPTWGPQITVQAVDADGNAIGRPRTHSTVPDQKQIDQVLRIRGEEGYDPGHLYEVNLHVEPHELLDWDKPLSEQSPQVQDLLPKAPDGVKQLPNGRWATTLNGEVFGRPTGWPDRGTAEEVRRMMREDLGDTSKWTGSDLHQYLVRRNPGNPARPTELMREAGIPGIRYRDAMSRDGRDDGTHNFVMFSHDPVEIVRKYSLRQNLTTALRDNTEEPRRVLAHALDQALFPMRLGSKAAQAAAFKFAQALRGIGFRYGQIDRQLVKQFTPEDRAAMGRALDAQSVFEQRVRSGEATEADRAAFDASKQGLAGLNDKQRQTVQALNQLAQQTWKRLQDRKLVKPDAEGLPAYMPRQFVMMDGLTGARRITPADNKIDGGDAAGGGGGGLTSMDQKGRNLTTAGPQRREYLTPEESERAAKAKFGDNATLVTDIRSLVDALQRQERAIAGRDMVDAIKRIGAETGIDLVREGEAKPDRGYFTLDHPALREYRVAGTDADGKPIYTRADIHIAEEFRGPLEAVLSQPAPDWYRGLMRVKGASMTAIMFSPYMHRMVEYGRAFPLLRTGIFRATSRGETLQRDRGYMDQAIRDGLAPIASGFRGMDAASIINEAAGLPVKNVVSRALSRIDEVAARGIGKVLGENAADTYLHPHEKLLWDKVRNLQVGIYAEMRDRFIAKGFSERGAGIMAAHLANRYAGALPSEHLSRFANMAANLAMFSRSFTLGNLAVAKDMLNGAPSHVRAALADAVGGEEAQRAQKALQRKAISAFVLDIGMMYAAYSLAQSAFTALRSQQQGDDLNETARKVWQEYVDGQSPAQGGYEPGKGNRAYIGNDTSGRGIYARLAAGKVAEDLVGWTPFAGHPGTMLLNKMNPLIRATWESVVGKDSLDRPVYRPNPQTMLEKIGVARDIALHIAGSMVPADFLQQTYEMAKGEERGDKGVAAARILAPLSGVGSISSGNKNGPEAGREQAVVANAQYDRTKARAEATRLYNLGREDEARSALEAGFGNDARAAAGAWRSIVNPARAQVRLNRSYQRITANP